MYSIENAFSQANPTRQKASRYSCYTCSEHRLSLSLSSKLPPQAGAKYSRIWRFTMFVDHCRVTGLGIVLALSGVVLLPSYAFAACTQTLSAGANIASAVSSATAGSTICLNDGNYSGFTLNGISKNPRVTVQAVNPLGASFTGDITFTGNTNGVTFDGFNFANVTISGANTRELTIRNYNQTGQMIIRDVTTATPNILLENFTHNNVTASTAPNARIWINLSGRSTPVATIRNGTIDGGCADGIQSGGPFILEDSRLMNMQVGSCPNDPHTDALQLYGGPFAGTIIRRNYFYRNVQVLSAYDGVDNVLIEDNVFDPGPDGERRPCQIELYSDANSIIRHNTVLYRGSGYGFICVDRKSTDDAGYGTIIVDNIANAISVNNGSTVAQRSKNLFRSGTIMGEILGAPTYVGGATPTTVDGFALTSTSLGKSAASSPAGSDIGASTGTSTLSAPTSVRIIP